MKIAVIGSGVSGLAAAHYLSKRHEVVLFEQAPRAGGHTNTFVVKTPQGELPVDTGFIVYNELNYPNLTAFFHELGVATENSDMSFGVSIEDGKFEYAGDNFASLFLQRSNIVSFRHWHMLLQILRFNSMTKRLLADNALPDITLGEFLDRHGFGDDLRARYLLPMAGAIWSTSTRDALRFPYPTFARFFDSHGLLNAVQRPQWKAVIGGSRRYVEKILSPFRGELRLGAKVERLRRTPDGAYVMTKQGEERFDAAVCATHTDQALSMLTDADEAERSVLSGIAYSSNIAYLHTDETLLPRRRTAWSSWNYMGPVDRVSDHKIPVTYWMNRLQNIPGPVNYLVSLNPTRQPIVEKTLYTVEYDHPQYVPATIEAQRRLPGIQGRRKVWWCGAWCGYGFHEDGLKSALRGVQAMDQECLPAWAKL